MYTAGFYKGVMTAGPFKGMTVQQAKPLQKKAMIDDGEAFTYLEPEGPVFPRSTPDVECVVALVDQWYLKYGEKEWKASVGAHLESTLECYNPAVKKLFRETWSGLRLGVLALLRPRHAAAVGPAVPHRVALGLDDLHGVLLGRPPLQAPRPPRT